MTRPVVLWATPRSVSTAFDKMMRSRGDHRVLTEPFSVPFYFGPDRCSERFAPRPDISAPYVEVWAELLVAADQDPVFVKEMPHHLGPHLTASSLARFTNSFLIRDPARSVPSFLARWPDATDEELGYQAQRRAFDLASADGTPAPVIDAEDLRADPARVVAAWCEAVGVEHVADALSWEAGLPDDWALWADWFERAATTTEFAPPEQEPPPDLDGQVAARVERCRRHYDVLAAHRLHGTRHHRPITTKGLRPPRR